MPELSLPHGGWRPRPYQEKVWKYLLGGGSRVVLRWHRRAGKDEVLLHHTACAAHERIGNYWYALPEYAQARKSMWDAVNPRTGRRRIDDVFPHALRETTREDTMMIKFKNGSTFQLVGSDNHDTLVGSPPVGLVFSEYALADPSAWAYLMPIVEENKGWVGFPSTPRGSNHFRDLCALAEKSDDWFYQSLTAEQTGIFTPEQLSRILDELQAVHGDEFGKALWLQEYFVSFDAAIPGSIWGGDIAKVEAAGRIAAVAVDPKHPVSTGWDLGRTDDTAIWFYQCIDGDVRFVDYHASNFKEIPWYGDYLRRWAKDNKVAYATHWLPHDARPRRLGMGGKSILQQLQDERCGRFAIAPRLDVEEGIQAARATFRRAWFDRERCLDGLEALKQYHRQWDAEKKMFSNTPLHDWSSHGADAMRTAALTWRQPKSKEPSTPFIEGVLREPLPSFGQMKARHLAKQKARREGLFV